MFQRGDLADHPSERHTNDVRGRRGILIEHVEGIIDQVIERIGRSPDAYVVERPVSRWS